MSFIGIIANKKCFENIRKKIAEESKEETINLIPINLRSIENIKNIKFETIVIEDSIEKLKKQEEILAKLLENTQYLIINTDKNKEMETLRKKGDKITYGLNQKATVTVSSISDTDILIYWQKGLKNKEGNEIEIEERRIKKKQKESNLKTYEILIIYTLFQLYQKDIMEEI